MVNNLLKFLSRWDLQAVQLPIGSDYKCAEKKAAESLRSRVEEKKMKVLRGNKGIRAFQFSILLHW